MTKIERTLSRYRDHGLLLLRLGVGAMFMWHGSPKMFGGVEMWTRVGKAMGNLGLDFAPAFWGFLASLAEFGGGLLLIVGLGVRFAAMAMCFTMVVAAVFHLKKGDGLKGASHAIELGIVFAGLVFVGGGRFSLDGRRGE